MVGINVLIPAGRLLLLRGWKDSLFGDTTCTALRASNFYPAARSSPLARWPDPATRASTSYFPHR